MVTKLVRTVGAAEFKATCLKLLDEVYETGLEVTITKRGVPIARLVPTRERMKELRALGLR